MKAPNLTRLLHSMSGLGVRPARICATLSDTTPSQYACVSGTTSSATPSASHTCARRDASSSLEALCALSVWDLRRVRCRCWC